MTSSFRRVLLLFPILFLAVAFAGLLAHPSDFYFPYPFWEEALKTLRRFTHVFAAIAFIFAFRRLPPLQNLFKALSRINRNQFLITILGFGFILRVVWSFYSPYQPTADGAGFMTLATHLLRENRFTSDGITPNASAAPGYPFFLAGVYAIFGNSLFTTQIAQSVMNIAMIGFVYLATEKIFGRTTAVLASVSLTFSLNQILTSAMVINEHLYLLAVLPAVYLLASDLDKDSWIKLLAAGGLLGISNLARGLLLTFPPFLFFLYLFARKGWGRSFLKTGVVTLMSVAVILPWTYRNYRTFGYPVPICTSAGFGFYTMNSPIADPYVTQLVEMESAHPEYRGLHPHPEVARYLGGSRYAREWILSDPWRFIRLGAGKLISFYGLNSYWSIAENSGPQDLLQTKILHKVFKKAMRYGYIFHFTLFFLGVFVLLFKYGWTRFDSKKMLILLLIYFLTGIHFLFCGQKRYRQSIDPFLFMTSAFMLVYIVKRDLITDGLSETVR